MTTQRNINKMSEWERRDAIRDAAKDLDRALKLFGIDESPIAELLASETVGEMESRLDEIMTPECSCRKGDGYCSGNHSFPPWFMRKAKPEARAFSQLWRQIQKAKEG